MRRAELCERSHASEKRQCGTRSARRRRCEQKKTLDALEKRLRDTRARAYLAEAGGGELKTAQSDGSRLESNGDTAFAQSPPSSTTRARCVRVTAMCARARRSTVGSLRMM